MGTIESLTSTSQTCGRHGTVNPRDPPAGANGSHLDLSDPLDKHGFEVIRNRRIIPGIP